MYEEKKSFKLFRTVSEQIQYLEKNKKIYVSEDEEHYFYERNYIELINPYKDLICSRTDKNGKHIYTHATQFCSMIKLIELDDLICDRLFILIRNFEKRFRNAIAIIISQKYKESYYKDEFGISYVDDVQTIELNSKESVIAPMLNKVIKKDKYVEDEIERIENKKSILKKIELTGLGKYSKKLKNNHPITRAINNQQIAPFWLVVSSLNFGDLQTLWAVQDRRTQEKIMRWTIGDDKSRNYEHRDLYQFSGKIESIRKLRNSVNHYLPFFALISRKKSISNLRYISAIKLLKKTFKGLEEGSENQFLDITDFDISDGYFFGIPVSDYNRNKIITISEIIEILNKKQST